MYCVFREICLSKKDDLIEIFDKQDEQDNSFLQNVRNLNDQVHRVEERKNERQAKRSLIENASEDFIDEVGPKFITIEKSDEETFGVYLAGFENSAENVINALNSTSGSTSAYVSEGVH